MNDRILKRLLSADTLGFFLVLLAIQVLLYGLTPVMRGTQTHHLFWVCLIAAAIGVHASRSAYNGIQITILSIALGLVIVWVLGARIAAPLLDLTRSLIAAGPRVVPHISYRLDINTSDIISSWNSISVSSIALMTRVQTWLPGAFRNFRVDDVLIRNMLWAFALWMLSAWIGWFAAQRNGMASLLPAVVLLTLLIWSTERRAESLWALVMIMLLLMGLWNFKNHVQHWEANRVDYSDSIRIDLGQSILMVAVVAGLMSYITPSISWRDIRDYLRERRQPQPTEVVVNPPGSTTPVAQSGRTAPKASLPREHLLTSGSALSEKIVMIIKTGELSPVPMQSQSINAPRYYWRSVIYDQYDGRGWFTTSAPPQSIAANQPMIAGVLTDYKLLHLDVQMQQPDGRLYWSGILYNANIPLAVDWRLRPQSNLFADQTALLQADMFAARSKATSYTADSLVSTSSIEQLRAATDDIYPQHIQDIYFSLPDIIPERVHRLAREITQGQPTQYDKAKAIETYLRTNYPYDLQIPAPPEDQDVSDYFLFDLKRGYCDYYATAMVVLARSSGIPARFVSGYASGDYDAASAQYVVRELHAHSWAEIYFPEIGWIEFEPTGNQPEIERRANNEALAKNDQEGSMTRNVLLPLIHWKWSVLFIPLLITLIAATLYFAVIEPLFFFRLAPPVAVEILYRRFYRSARPLAREHTHAETAYEFQNKLLQTIQWINTESRHSTSMLQKDVIDLATIYQTVLFSDHRIEHQDIKNALMISNRLRRSLIFEKIKYFFWMRNKTSH